MSNVTTELRHTANCLEGQACGHSKAHCTCSPAGRAHEDWEAIELMVERSMPKLEELDVNGRWLLRPRLARALYALSDMHEAIVERLEENGEIDPCKI